MFNKLNIYKQRTIKFELLKVYDDQCNYLLFKTINIGQLQQYVIKLCNKYNVLFKTVQQRNCKCKIKIYSNYTQFIRLYKEFLNEYGEYIINIKT